VLWSFHCNLCYRCVEYWTACVYCRIFCEEKTCRKCIRKFRRKYPDSPVHTASCVSKPVKKWQATGSVSHNLFMRCKPFFNQLTSEERQQGYFQQDNTTTHTANATMVTIREVFEDWIIYLFIYLCDVRHVCKQKGVTFSTCYKAQ
jgi:hypothetical protein